MGVGGGEGRIGGGGDREGEGGGSEGGVGGGAGERGTVTLKGYSRGTVGRVGVQSGYS